MQAFNRRSSKAGPFIGLFALLTVGFFTALCYTEPKDVAAALGNVFGGTIGALGAALAVYLTFEGQRRREEDLRRGEMESLATMLTVEIHNRAARCLLDGITWATKHVDGGKSRRRIHCPKFRPFSPTVYKVVADRLTELPPSVAHQVVRFYNALEAADRQVVDLTENPAANIPADDTSSNENKLVAARFHQTFLPAQEALRSLLPLAANSGELEQELANADRQYLGAPSVLSALTLTEPPLLREALRIRFEWFGNHRELRKFMNYSDESEN